MLARVQGIKIGNTVNPKDDSFAINELICSIPTTARRVLQTLRKWPEMAGSKWGWIAKPPQQYQRLGPEPDRLPLHHSPRFMNDIRDLIGILRVIASDE